MPSSAAESVSLISGEGDTFNIAPDLAKQSPVLAMFLDPQLGFHESLAGEIHLPDISSRMVQRIIEYLQWRERAAAATAETTPQEDFVVDPKEATELLLVADYLDV